MDGQGAAKRATVRAVAVLGGPCVAVLLLLVLAGELAPGPALLAALAMLAVIALPLRRHFAALGHFADRIGALDTAGAPDRPTSRGPRSACTSASATPDA